MFQLRRGEEERVPGAAGSSGSLSAGRGGGLSGWPGDGAEAIFSVVNTETRLLLEHNVYMGSYGTALSAPGESLLSAS